MGTKRQASSTPLCLYFCTTRGGKQRPDISRQQLNVSWRRLRLFVSGQFVALRALNCCFYNPISDSLSTAVYIAIMCPSIHTALLLVVVSFIMFAPHKPYAPVPIGKSSTRHIGVSTRVPCYSGRLSILRKLFYDSCS